MPKNLTARAKTWSNYKYNHTAKYLIGFTPSGAVMFLSAGWRGRVSDKQISVDSATLIRFQCVIVEELVPLGATLKVPHFTKGKSQFSEKEVDTSR